VIVDGREFVEQVQHDFSLIEPYLVYLAGSDDTYRLTNHLVTNNFVGTISEVRYVRLSQELVFSPIISLFTYVFIDLRYMNTSVQVDSPFGLWFFKDFFAIYR